MNINWHERFQNQLRWNEQSRDYLLKKIDWNQFDKHQAEALEVGCGTGALLMELRKKIDFNKWNVKLSGIDNNVKSIECATNLLKKSYPDVKISHKDIISTDFQCNSFDIIFSNFLFLWIENIEKALDEIHRILKPNGYLIIFSEPDYGGLIENPESGLRRLLLSNLRMNGADPEIARKIPQVCSNKFEIIETFTSSIPWTVQNNRDNLCKELMFFKEVYNDSIGKIHHFSGKKGKMKEKEGDKTYLAEFQLKIIESALKNEQYFLFIPVFSYFLMKS